MITSKVLLTIVRTVEPPSGFTVKQLWTLFDAVDVDRHYQCGFEVLSGMSGTCQVLERVNLRDLKMVRCISLENLNQWLCWKAFKILLMTTPKVFTGFSSY